MRPEKEKKLTQRLYWIYICINPNPGKTLITLNCLYRPANGMFDFSQGNTLSGNF
jgi:hypothetical protein